MSGNARLSRAGSEGSDPPNFTSSSSSVRVAEVLLIQSTNDADGTTSARFYASPSARSLPGPSLPEYHPKPFKSPVLKPREREKADRGEGRAGGMPSVVTRQEETPNGEGGGGGEGGGSLATTNLTHRNLLGPAAVHPSAISLSNPEVPGLLARILIVAGDDTLVDALEPWMIKKRGEQEDDGEGRGEACKVGFPERDFKRFIGAHMNADNDELHQEEENAAEEQPNFVCVIGWWRRRVQDLSSFVVERKIADGRPWSTDGTSTPWNRAFDRYYLWPSSPHRYYHLLSTSQEGGVAINAAQECMSLCWAVVDGIETGVLLADMIPHYKVRRVRTTEMGLEMELREDPHFIPRFLATVVDDGERRLLDKEADKDIQMVSGETINNMVMRNPHPGFKTRREREEEPTPRTRLTQFVNALVEVESMPHGRPQDFVQSVIAHMVCQDLSDLLRSIGLVLDSIELSLHDDYILQQAMPAWRAFLGTWRNICYHQSALLQRMASQIARTPDPRNKTSVATADLTQSLSRVMIKLDRLSQRVESTFQSLMSSITIVESSRAITQAELVTKLTQLAFFFIPLSLVAGAFGMNINEFEGQLVWWHWILASAAVSITTYLILYGREIYKTIKSLSKQTKMGLAAMPAVAGLSVATWALSLSSLPSPAKAIISVFGIWIPPLFFFRFFVGTEESVRQALLHSLVITILSGLCTAEWRLVVSASIPIRVKVAVGPLIFLVPLHLMGFAEDLHRQMHKAKRSHDSTGAPSPRWLRNCLHLITAGTTTGFAVATWELRASTLPVGVQVGISSVLAWLLAVCMCALHIYPRETSTGPRLDGMRLVYAVATGIVAVVVLAVTAWQFDDSGAPTTVKAAIAPLLFWLPVACMDIWWTQHRGKGEMTLNIVVLLGLLIGVSIGAWKIGDSRLDADVKTAARMWAIWYAPAVVYGCFKLFFSATRHWRVEAITRRSP